MPTISIFYGIVIQMFWREHNPPHFHATYGGEEAIIDIRTLAVMEGSLSRRALPMVLEWAQAHEDELLEDWELCQRKQHPKDRAPAVTPSLAPWRVASVTPLAGWRLRVRFNDGLEGWVEMEREVHAADAGVFSALADPEVFAAARVVFGAVTWPGDIDLAPDAMHAEIKANGRWVL